jgi:hypothetical protein
VVHFGLGSAADVIQIVVRWPSGRRQVISDVMVDQLISVVEPLIATG